MQPNQDEQNFHIFYQILAGLTTEERSKPLGIGLTQSCSTASVSRWSSVSNKCSRILFRATFCKGVLVWQVWLPRVQGPLLFKWLLPLLQVGSMYALDKQCVSYGSCRRFYLQYSEAGLLCLCYLCLCLIPFEIYPPRRGKEDAFWGTQYCSGLSPSKVTVPCGSNQINLV